MLDPYIQRADRDQVAYRRLLLLLGVSLLCHICVAGVLAMWLKFDEQEARAQAQASSVQVRFMSDADLQRVLKEARNPRTRTTPKEKEKKEEEKRPPETKEKPYRPEDTLAKRPEVQPKEADYSGRQASVAERQQVKRGMPGSATPMQRTPSPAAEAVPRPPTPEAAQQPNKVEEKEAKQRSSDLPLPKAQDQDKSSVVVTPEEPSAAGKSDRPSPLKRPSQAPSAQALFAPQVAPSVLNEMGDNGVFNSLEDIPDGDKTELNRVRSRYWIFWDRFTRQIKRHWNPVGELRKRDPYGNVYGVGAFQTVVNITLKADGSVQKIRVEQSSEHDFLDDEAVRAITAAAPFINPPEGLKDEDGLIHVRFGFILELVSGEFRLFRMNPERPF